MAKQTTALPLTLPRRTHDLPAYRWLYEAIRSAILDGRLRPGVRLPSTRDVAEQYDLSRGTIVAAFEQLQAEGYVESVVGSGTVVSRILPDELLHVAGSGRRSVASRPRRLSGYASRVTPFALQEVRPARAFRTDLPAIDLFPVALWAQVASRRLRRLSLPLLRGCEPMGYAPLRQAVADYLTSSRGVNCRAEQIAIVSGAQEALDLIARLTLDRGDAVCIEDPGYPGASIVFEAIGAKVRRVAVDDDGMRTPRTAARLAYVTPAHQFPLGMTMSLPRRLALLEWARASRALIFEDDYDSEFRYSGRPMPALQGLDHDGVVVYAGTFSKVLFPSLRLGYVVVPDDLVERVNAAKSLTTRHAPVIDQAIVCDFISEGHFSRHLRRMREVYAERLKALTDAVRRRLGGALELSGIDAGLQTVGRLAKGIDANDVVAAAAKRNVEVGAVGAHALQLGFAAIDVREIRRGVDQLALAIESLR